VDWPPEVAVILPWVGGAPGGGVIFLAVGALIDGVIVVAIGALIGGAGVGVAVGAFIGGSCVGVAVGVGIGPAWVIVASPITSGRYSTAAKCFFVFSITLLAPFDKPHQPDHTPLEQAIGTFSFRARSLLAVSPYSS